MRGKLSSLPALLLALGVLLGYVLGNNVDNRASNEGYPKVPEDFTITETATTSAFSYAKWALTPQ